MVRTYINRKFEPEEVGLLWDVIADYRARRNSKNIVQKAVNKKSLSRAKSRTMRSPNINLTNKVKELVRFTIANSLIDHT